MEATHLYIAEAEGCVSLNVSVLIRTRLLIVELFIWVELSEMISLSVPLSILIQVISGIGTPSTVQENMAESGATTPMLAGGLVIVVATGVTFSKQKVHHTFSID